MKRGHRKLKLGLVLGAGLAKGFVHVGVLKVLHEQVFIRIILLERRLGQLLVRRMRREERLRILKKFCKTPIGKILLILRCLSKDLSKGL